MRKSRFTDEQIVAILAEAHRGEKTIGDVCRAHGVSEPTFYNWRKRFRGMGVEEEHEQERGKSEGRVLHSHILHEPLLANLPKVSHGPVRVAAGALRTC